MPGPSGCLLSRHGSRRTRKCRGERLYPPLVPPGRRPDHYPGHHRTRLPRPPSSPNPRGPPGRTPGSAAHGQARTRRRLGPSVAVRGKPAVTPAARPAPTPSAIRPWTPRH